MTTVFGELDKLKDPELAPNLPVWLQPVKEAYGLNATPGGQVGGGGQEARAEEGDALGADGTGPVSRGRGRSRGAVGRRGRGRGGSSPPATAPPPKRRKRA